MRVFNALLQVVVMKLLSSSKSRVFARVRVCCVYLQMRVEILKKGDFKFFNCVLTKSVSTGGGTRKYAKAHSLSLSATIYTTTTTTL